MATTSLPIKIPTAIPNLYLRTPEATDHDAEGISKVFAHKFNNRFEPDRPGRAEPTPALYAERIPKWIDMAEKGQNAFCLIALAPQDNSNQDQIIGFGGINSIHTRSSMDEGGNVKAADVGVMLHEPFTGKGYGTAALRATIQASFDVFGANLVEAETMVINKPFRGLMAKLKLDRFSERRTEDGIESVFFSFTKAQWESVQ